MVRSTAFPSRLAKFLGFTNTTKLLNLLVVAGAWPQQYEAAELFIQENMGESHKVTGKQADRFKAIITASDQFSHPGDSMSIIIGRNGLPESAFRSARLSRDLVIFLTATPWPTPQES